MSNYFSNLLNGDDFDQWLGATNDSEILNNETDSENSNRLIIYFNKMTSRKPTYNLPSQGKCGDPDEDFISRQDEATFARIIGGAEVVPNSYPWMVSLKYLRNNTVQNHFCGGSLVYDEWILTAAHCLKSIKKENFIAILGLHVLNDTSKNGYKIEKIFLHDNFNISKQYYDIALIKLVTKVAISRTISTVCLPDKNSDAILNKTGIVIGWGRTDPNLFINENLYRLRKLQQATLRIINGDNLCTRNLQTFESHNLYCAYDVNMNGYSGACIGDSGGPFVININGRFYIYGVVSSIFTLFDIDGSLKCLTKAPTYLSKVPNHIDWIAKTITENSKI